MYFLLCFQLGNSGTEQHRRENTNIISINNMVTIQFENLELIMLLLLLYFCVVFCCFFQQTKLRNSPPGKFKYYYFCQRHQNENLELTIPLLLLRFKFEDFLVSQFLTIAWKLLSFLEIIALT